MRICGLFYDGASKSDYAASSDRMTDEFVRIRKEAVLTSSRYTRICLEGIKLIAKHLGQSCWWSGLNANQASTKYEFIHFSLILWKKSTSSSRNVTVVLQIMFIAMLMWIQLDLHDNFDISSFLFRKLFRVFLAVYMYGRSQGIVFAIITWLRSGQSKNLVLIFGRPVLGPAQPFIQSVAEPLSLGIKW